jgi:hypothetical protein
MGNGSKTSPTSVRTASWALKRAHDTSYLLDRCPSKQGAWILIVPSARTRSAIIAGTAARCRS